MSVSNTGDIGRLDMVLHDRPAGRNIIGYAIDTIERLRAELAAVNGEDHADRCAQSKRLKAQLAELHKDAAIGRLVRRRLVSGNSIPVSRAYVTAAEVHDIDAGGGE